MLFKDLCGSVIFITTWNISLLMHMSDAQHQCARFVYHSHLHDVQVPLSKDHSGSGLNES